MSRRDTSNANELQGQSGILWTPWRMDYVGGSSRREAGCIFCNRLAASNDVDHLILIREEHVFAILNLFPYNTGHVMIVPNVHVASPESLDEQSLTAMTLLTRRSLEALRRALNCEGFNVGLNIGAPAGAGVAEHMHQHIVPRWTGDANFMPILSGTMVMPELLPVTYAKVRAEFARASASNSTVRIACFNEEGDSVAVVASGENVELPGLNPVGNDPLWKTAVAHLAEAGITARLIGWGGSETADSTQHSGLLFIGENRFEPGGKITFVPVHDMLRQNSGSVDHQLLTSAVERFRAGKPGAR